VPFSQQQATPQISWRRNEEIPLSKWLHTKRVGSASWHHWLSVAPRTVGCQLPSKLTREPAVWCATGCCYQARTEAEHMRQECRRLEVAAERRQGQLEDLQAAYDDVLERLKFQSAALLQALGSGGSLAGGADETAMSQV
jgi:hypothetical protein